MMAASCVGVVWVYCLLPLLPMVFGLPDSGKGMPSKLDISRTAFFVLPLPLFAEKMGILVRH